MKTAVFVKAGQMAIETIEKPSVIEVDDAVSTPAGILTDSVLVFSTRP